MMSSKLPVCLEVGQKYEPKAKYALRMLLKPLGLGPIFQSRTEIHSGGIYYGENPVGLPPKVIPLPWAPSCEEFFDQFTPVQLASIQWRKHQKHTYPVIFTSTSGDDLVASAFYWLSGWQEFTEPARDEYGRFPHSKSLQKALGVTCLPIVDFYREALKEKLLSIGVEVQPKLWKGRSWAFCPTIDVDYLQHWRPGMIFREKIEYFVLNRRKVNLKGRWQRLFRFLNSYFTPGDAFKIALTRMVQKIGVYGRATIFMKAAAHGPNDVFYKLNQPYLDKLLKVLQSANFEIGLHPSYHAHTHLDYLRTERRRLTAFAGNSPASIRQHYLRYEPSITPHLQSRSGFLIDSSLGFAEHSGFRNGTCMPFQKFDCIHNEVTNIWEMPLVMMDGALFNRQNLSSQEAINHSIELLKLCQQFGGVAVALWHNVIGEEIDYPGWGEHFERVLQWSHDQGASISSLQDSLSSWLGYPIGSVSNL